MALDPPLDRDEIAAGLSEEQARLRREDRGSTEGVVILPPMSDLELQALKIASDQRLRDMLR